MLTEAWFVAGGRGCVDRVLCGRGGGEGPAGGHIRPGAGGRYTTHLHRDIHQEEQTTGDVDMELVIEQEHMI